MANHKSALKRIRQTVKRTERNKQAKASMRTFTKKVASAIEAGDVESAQSALREASAVIAKTAQRGIIHKNQAARRISRLNAGVKKLALAAG
uniref:Small ribosomal subunit protein bS20 n=1 Tax=Magnetococcus massalia (strain MO-1) TaxID=451514 RepID=A0A1S7LPG4_MAGMO|nr:30S ribosomal protein S20 [Candidatus Magnetococcus massalia]